MLSLRQVLSRTLMMTWSEKPCWVIRACACVYLHFICLWDIYICKLHNPLLRFINSFRCTPTWYVSWCSPSKWWNLQGRVGVKYPGVGHATAWICKDLRWTPKGGFVRTLPPQDGPEYLQIIIIGLTIFRSYQPTREHGATLGVYV